LTFSPDGRFAYTGTAAEYDGSLAGFQRDAHGGLIRFNPNPATPPGPGPGDGFCYASNSASSSAGYVAVQWWAGLYCENLPVVGIANYTVNDDGTLALVPGSEILSPATLQNMVYDPSGQYLAIVGSIGSWPSYEGAIQIYKLQAGGGLVAAGPVQLVPGAYGLDYGAWDSAGHLFVVSGPSRGLSGLYVFNNNDGVLTPAPGSPHAVTNIVSLAVFPAS
jgi:6-phosphogluconolactonase (cycloisomerase 2 family)